MGRTIYQNNWSLALTIYHNWEYLRPQRDLSKNKKLKFCEFTPITLSFDKTKCDVIIFGDFNINILKINEKEVFGDFVIY